MGFIARLLAVIPYHLYIALLGLVCYANTLGNGFVFDDSAYLTSALVRNPAIGDLLLTNWLGLDIYRPLTLLSLGLDFSLYQETPLGYHLSNLVLHLINGVLLYKLARDLLGEDHAALWAALLYVSHPIQTEVVAWVSARGDLLGTLFFLCAFLAHRRDLWRWRIAAWILYGAAVLSKETALVLPGVLFLQTWYLDRSGDSRTVFLWTWIKRNYGYGVVLLAALVLRWLALADSSAPTGPASTNFLADLDTWQRIGTIVAILPRYLLLLVVPRHLSADYSYASIPPITSLVDPWFAFGVLSIAVFVILSRYTRSRIFYFIGLFFWICLLPVSNLFFLAPSGMAERYLHLAMIPVSLMAGWGGWQGAKWATRRGAWAAILCLVVMFSVGTVSRNRDWHSDVSLFSGVLRHYPENARAHDNLGFAYYQQGQYAQAIHHYQKAVAIQPTRLRALFNLGLLYSQSRRYDEAVTLFKTALSVYPNHVESHFNLGLTYQKTRRYEQAIGHYLSVLSLQPGHLKAYYNLGRAYERVDRPEAAIAQYTALIGLDGNASKAYYRLGEVYYAQQRYQEMASAWTTLLRLQPYHREGERIRRLLQQIYR